jgi:alanyl-tRNA synthetase
MDAPTRRLYQRDSFLTRFKATILDVRAVEPPDTASSARIGVLLDRTAFYPTGGGQPNDTGTLAGMPVVDVHESGDGPLHVLEMRDSEGRAHGACLTVGAEVDGVIDWTRRFDHMQQHSGQHLLSRAFLDVAEARTRSFHLGAVGCTIDVELSSPDERVIRQAEGRANEIIWADRPVTVREIDAGEAPASALDESALVELSLKPGDSIRLIDVEGFDSTACGGTHVARSGQVGMIALTAFERFKGMCRVSFVCGGRVAEHLHAANDALDGCIARLSAKPPELPAAIDRLLQENQALQRRVASLTADLARHEAASLAASAPQVGPFRVLTRIFAMAERSLEAAQALARQFVEEPGRLALVAVIQDGEGTLFAARSAKAAGGAGAVLQRLGPIVTEVCHALGGKGGGSETFARAGGIPEARVPEVIETVTTRLAAATPTGRP